MAASSVASTDGGDLRREVGLRAEPAPSTTAPAGGLSSMPLPRAHASAVILGVVLIQLAADVVAGRESARILARLAFMALSLPVLMVALSAAFRWCLRRRMNSWQVLLTGVLIATSVGMTFGFLYGLVSVRVPSMRFHGGVSFTRSSLYGVLNAQLYLGLWALAFVFPYAVDSARVRALEAQQLRSELELARLRVHLEPHFLLNTLNAIAGLVTEEPREARRLIVCLGDLLREAVHAANERSDTETVEKQVAWLRRYAQILEARHSGALRFRWEVADASAAAEVPRLLLQPLVENAVMHGALRRGDGQGEVVVRTSMIGRPGQAEPAVLVCVVEDNGPGMPDADLRAGAFGLQAVRRRLALQSPRASLRLESSRQGTRSIVEIPVTPTPPVAEEV